ncbi:hypothetical protein NBRC116585_06300 [Thalassolituus maritimus]|uniref:Uncharacterized protein n=1 Tax=Thalassolituus maritimus TaxID=484498 RepID=A0ABP9ZWL1_9GAMM
MTVDFPQCNQRDLQTILYSQTSYNPAITAVVTRTSDNAEVAFVWPTFTHMLVGGLASQLHKSVAVVAHALDDTLIKRPDTLDTVYVGG